MHHSHGVADGGEEDVSMRVEGDAPPSPVEEGLAQALLELTHRARKRGGAQVHRGRRGGEMLALGDRAEGRQPAPEVVQPSKSLHR